MVEKVIWQNGGADAEAEKLKRKVLNSENALDLGGRIYYVSSNGDDANDASTPDKPIKSFEKLSEIPLEKGDTVLFERGSFYRIAETYELVGGVNYGAYGKGEKPVFSGSLRDYADSSLWSLSEEQNIWQMPLNTKGIKSASLITFNNEEYVGVWKETKAEVLKDGDFYHDTEKGILYLYFKDANPGDYFDNIEIATTNTMFISKFTENINVDNLSIKHVTRSALLFGECNKISVTNCVISWMGGAVWNHRPEGTVRYGNAVEFWYQCHDIVTKGCWMYQIFDAAVTFQGSGDKGAASFENIHFDENLIEYCSMNIEYWVGNGASADCAHIKDITYKGDIVRFSGYGWSGIQRPDKGSQALLLGWNRKYDDLENFVISDCIFDCADGHMIFMYGSPDQKGLYFENNSYYQKTSPCTKNAFAVVRDVSKTATNQEDLQEAILMFDTNPKLVKWLG